MEHSELSPSGLSAAAGCRGKILMSRIAKERYGEPPASDPALKGSALHHLPELQLTGQDTSPEDYEWEDAKGNKQILSQDDIEACLDPYYALIEGFIEAHDGELVVEERYEITDQVSGTADATILADGRLIIVDLKTGHHKVEAEDNMQLKAYALGALLKYDFIYDFKDVTVCISQGRIGHTSIAEYTADEIRAFHRELLDLEEAVFAVDALDQQTPNENSCQFCEARSFCPGLDAYVRYATDIDHVEMGLMELADAMKRIPAVKAWIKGVEDQVKEQVEKGQKVPGYKMVEGRRTRNWKSEEEVEKFLKHRVRKFKEVCYNMKLKTPAQMEKALKPEVCRSQKGVDLESVVVWSGGHPTVVPESDKRDALEYGDRAANDFKEIVDA